MLKTFILSIKLLWRDLRSGEWIIVLLALILAVSSVTTLNFFTDRIEHGLENKGKEFLGGDLAIVTPSPIPLEWFQLAKNYHLQTATILSFPTMARFKNKFQLVTIQAVSQQFPLIGHYQKISHGTVWMDPRIFSIFQMKRNDFITIGSKNFPAVNITPPAFNLISSNWLMSPKIIMSINDVPATQTIVSGSRVNYILLIKGDSNQVNAFRMMMSKNLQTGQRILDVRNQNATLKLIFARMQNYLQLVLLICTLMSAIAIIISAKYFLQKHATYIALMRVFGSSAQQIIIILVCQLIVVAVLAGMIGVLIAYFVQNAFEHLVTQLINLSLPNITFYPILMGFGLSIFLLFISTFPILKQLPTITPLSLWREEQSQKLSYSIFGWLGIFVLLFFIYLFFDFSLLTLLMICILGIGITFLYGIILLVVILVRKNLNHFNGAVHRGFSQILQYQNSINLQFIGFTLIITFLIFLRLVSHDLINTWKKTLPLQTPNYFVFNLSENDLPKFRNLFRKNNIMLQGIYPITRGRIISLNGKPILEMIPQSARQHNALHRELNLSYMWTFPSDNKIVRGGSWSYKDLNQNLISIEESMAKEFHLKIGDVLSFRIGDQIISGKIFNFRQVDWTSFHPNFYVIFTPGNLENFPTAFITSFYLKQTEVSILNEIMQQFPNATIIDVANLMRQIQDLLQKVGWAVEVLFLSALGSGILIFAGSFQSTLAERKQTLHILRTLGASRYFIFETTVIEFGSLIIVILISSIVLSLLITKLMMFYFF